MVRFCTAVALCLGLAVAPASVANAGFLDWFSGFFGYNPQPSGCSTGVCEWAEPLPGNMGNHLPSRMRAPMHRPRDLGRGAAARDFDGAEYQSCPC